MAIKWVSSISEKACNRTAVRVLQTYPRLAGKIGLVCRWGHTGTDHSVEVYQLEVKDPKGGTKKHVVASVHCRLYQEGEDQSRGSAAGQKGGSGDRNSELSRHTRSGGGLVEPSPSASVMKGQSAARVRWV
jgi:hypothetical protein